MTPTTPRFQVSGLAPLLFTITRLPVHFVSLSFDLARESYARAVQAGLVKSSLLASAKFGQALARLEQWSLGPWARRV